MARTALIAGVLLVLSVCGAPLVDYVNGRNLSNLTVQSMVLPALALLTAPVFLVAALATLVQIVRGKRRPAWLLAIMMPPVLIMLAANLPRPTFLDGAATTIAAAETEESLQEYVRFVRRYQANNPSLFDSLGVEIDGPLLERLPSGLRSENVAHIHLEKDHATITFGPRQGNWGIIIHDSASEAGPREAERGVNIEYKRVFESVWLFYNWA